ncbi:MAG: hypothetical protein EA001_02070 [Oscillatoriales cyanobacterium]|nr:MAG: hypothetical protein EA001_02070 [Oscillatoriales cyanobacterium]
MKTPNIHEKKQRRIPIINLNLSRSRSTFVGVLAIGNHEFTGEDWIDRNHRSINGDDSSYDSGCNLGCDSSDHHQSQSRSAIKTSNHTEVNHQFMTDQ